MSKTAVLVPSLGRPQHVLRTVGNIAQNTPELHTQIWCVSGAEYTDQLDELGFLRLGGLSHTDPSGFYLDDSDDDDKRYVTRMNKLCARVREITGLMVAGQRTGWDSVFFGSDDVVHHPFWLSQALEVMEQASEAAVVVVNDLRNPSGTQALVRTSYLPLAVFDDPGAAFHHGYHHNFADTEMFQTARVRGVIYRAEDSHVEHLHPLHQGSNQRGWDETYADAQRHWDGDANLYHDRMVTMKEALGAND